MGHGSRLMGATDTITREETIMRGDLRVLALLDLWCLVQKNSRKAITCHAHAWSSVKCFVKELQTNRKELKTLSLLHQDLTHSDSAD